MNAKSAYFMVPKAVGMLVISAPTHDFERSVIKFVNVSSDLRTESREYSQPTERVDEDLPIQKPHR